MNTDLIREALERQADRAPDAQKVRRALAVRTAQHARLRRRRQFAAIATAAAVIPVVLGLARHLAPGRADPAGQIVVVPPRTIPLYYRPTWLPSGVREATDAMPIDPSRPYQSTSHSYTRGQGNPRYADVPLMKLSVFVGEDRVLGRKEAGVTPEPITVNGVPGTYQKGSFGQFLTWQPNSVTTVFLEENLGLDKTTLQRIARSVAPDPGSRTIPFTVGWWPRHLSEGRLEVSAPGRPGMATIDAGTIQVTVEQEADPHLPPGGQPLTVNGHPAQWIPDSGNRLTYLIVALKQQRVLTVAVNNGMSQGPDIGQADSVRIAQSVVIDEAWPDWTTAYR